ncbi:MAG: hypothetical protein GAK37_00688 [Pseudomonas sp.]|nr:MAG: hypothetical protein GAK37_00688 [Pseudomonas sp.]
MKRTLLASLLLAGLPLAALAIEPGPSSKQQKETENWLQLQASGQLASSQPQKAAPAEREQALQRLLDSYKFPIPEYFEQKRGGQIPSGSN